MTPSTRTLIKDLAAKQDQPVLLKGWVDTVRDQGKILFLALRDRSGTIQCVVFGKPAVLEEAKRLRPEWVVAVEGVVHARPEKSVNPNEAMGRWEVEVTALTVIAPAQELPFDPDAKLQLDTLLDYRPLTLRRERIRAIFLLQAALTRAYRAALAKEGFTEIHPPKLVGEDAEGGSGVFRVSYLKDRDAYLATSPQLYKQIMVGVFERVYMTGNVFRAEMHATTRHINEYTSLDAEMGFIDSEEDVMRMLERVVRHMVEEAAQHHKHAFALWDTAPPLLPTQDFPRIHFREAQRLISKNTGVDCTQEIDLDPSHERWLCAYARREFNSDFIFVTHYPAAKRPFYTFRDPEDPEHTLSFDLLFRGVEIATGGQRIHHYEEYLTRLKEKGLNPDLFSFYLQAFRWGMPPHGGWGMGLERLTQKFLNLANIKEATLFPRDMNRIDVLFSRKSHEGAQQE